MRKISKENGRFEFINELKCKSEEYFIVCLDIISFRTVNDIYGFEEGDALLKELINCINSLNKTVKIDSFIYEKDNIYLVVGCTDDEIIKKIIKNIAYSKFSYDIKLRCAYRKISNTKMSLEFVENVNKVIRKSKYIIENDEYDFDASYDIDEYIAIKEDLISDKESFFNLVYQPKVEIKTNKIYSCEVLCRWDHPKLGVIGPYQFLPIIKGLHKECYFDLFVFEKACKEIKYLSKYINKFSVNMSINTIKEENISEKIYMIAEEYNIDSENITIEILEDISIDDYSCVLKNIHRLKELGFYISIDDFGTGYSSYYRLSKLNFSEVKIPREFLLEENTNKHKKMLNAVISMCKELDCKIVIEGVETEEQRALVESMGADYIQGYFYSKPLVKQEFLKFIKAYN